MKSLAPPAARRAVIAGGVLAIFVLLLYAPLLWTNRVYASGDILLYFYPYRDAAASALREGRIPLWNPYSFLGVPLLANPQAAALYPLHWPLSWLPVTRQIAWSAALHTWILGMGGYALLRRWGQSAWAALVGGLVLAGSGFYGGLVGHINQMNGAAWLPWALWVLAGVDASGIGHWRAWLRRVAEFGLLVALMFLAGHTQTLFINLAGLGAWVVWPLLWPPIWRQRSLWRDRLDVVLPRLGVYALGVALGLPASGAQLLPTLELSRLGLRGSGLSYAEASSFSLKPLKLFWTLLPSYGLADLSVVFATMGYSEFVAYVGPAGLGLAAWGAWRGRGAARNAGLLLAGLGLFLALGRWNPVYYLLYWVVPGFDLFRVPARWMMLYTLGMAILAGAGVDAGRGWVRGRGGLRARTLTVWLLPLGVALVGAELIAAAQALPHTHPTAPQAVYDVRTAPAHLRSDPMRAALHPAAAGRFVSMSTLTFDPGDMADYRRILREGARPLLDQSEFAELITALKSQEILAPNLALLWRVPSVDGFDGGVLPLQRYLDLVTLFVPPTAIVPDGRLREQLRSVPPADLLALLNVQYVITDKVRDLWFEDVYYDRQIGARLDAAYPQTRLDIPIGFPATHLHLIGYVDGPAAALAGGARTVGRVRVEGVTAEGAGQADFDLTAGDRPGAQLADPALGSPPAAAAGAQVAYRDVEGGRQEYLVKLPLPTAMRPTTITVAWQGAPAPLVVQAATLVDARTGQFAALLPSDRGHFRLVHSGDVKVYENLDVLPRAYLAQQTVAAADAAAALDLIRDRAVDLRGAAVVEGWPKTVPLPAAQAEPAGEAQMVSYAPERVAIRTRSPAPALLILADTFYPGWQATVDGDPAPIYRTNVLLRGVPVPAGEHEVVFRYAPASWRQGLLFSAAGGVLLLLCWAAPWLRARPVRAVPLHRV